MQIAREFDPQVFHLDPEAAKRTLFGKLVASGWHTAAVSMRLFVETMNVAGGIIGMSVDELRWPHAVRPGDELRVEIEIVNARTSKSRPGCGIIRIHNVTKNQRDEIVQIRWAVKDPCRFESGHRQSSNSVFILAGRRRKT